MMRLCTGLVVLLMVPSIHAAPEAPASIHLHGHVDDHIVLLWDVRGGDVSGLELVRVLDGNVTVVPLDDGARSHVDAEVGPDQAPDVLYFLRGRSEEGPVISNVYGFACAPVSIVTADLSVHIRTECLPTLPLVPTSLQTTAKEVVARLVEETHERP